MSASFTTKSRGNKVSCPVDRMRFLMVTAPTCSGEKRQGNLGWGIGGVLTEDRNEPPDYPAPSPPPQGRCVGRRGDLEILWQATFRDCAMMPWANGAAGV